MKKYISHSEEETKKIAQTMATEFKQSVIALTGELGAGKTTFVQGFAKGLGIKEKIISPTFVLIRQHKIPRFNKMLYHIDLYRLDISSQLKNLGIDELVNNHDNLVLIEWAERLNDLPKNTIQIIIKKQENNDRLITVS